MFNVTIKTLDGRDSLFTVEDDTLVSSFKEQISARLDIPVPQQRLIFQGRVLQDDTVLKTCSVEDKVVHLVPRPPPSAVPRSDTTNDTRQPGHAPSVSTSGSVTGGMATFFPIPWNTSSEGVALDMAQTIQDITAGILSGVGSELGRSAVAEPMHVVPGVGGRSGEPQFLSRGLNAAEVTFNRLHRQASHLRRRIMRQLISLSTQCTPRDEGLEDYEGLGENHISSVPGTLTSSPSYSSEERLADGTAQPGTQLQATAAMDNGGCQLSFPTPSASVTMCEDSEPGELANDGTVPSPMSVDYGDGQMSNIDATVAVVNVEGGTTPASSADHTGMDLAAEVAAVQPPGTSTTGGDAVDATDRHNLGQLADMLSRYRQLWRSVEPYLDNWESMLRKECQVQHQEGLEQQQTGQEEVTQEPSVEVSGEDSTVGDPAGQEIRHVWHQRFFSQVSRLLHLHAHMLHLLSDLNVISLPSNTHSTTVTNTTESNAQSSATSGCNEPLQATLPTMSQNSASIVSPPTSQENRRRPRRVLINWFRNRATMDMHPHVIWSTAPSVGTVPGVSMPTPAPASSRSNGQVPGTPPLDRRRSQSASDLHRGANVTTAVTSPTEQQHTTPVSANADVYPGTVNVSAGPPIAIRPQFFSSMGGGGGRGSPAAIIHRVDIPLVSMSMINIPSAHFLSVPSVGRTQIPIVSASSLNDGAEATISAEVVATTVSTTDSGVSAPALSTTSITTEVPTSTGETNSADVTSTGAVGSQPIFVTASDRGAGGTPLPGCMVGPTDPFLPCHSRHFGYETHRHHPQHRNAIFSLGGLSPFISPSSSAATTANQTTTAYASPSTGPSLRAGVASSTAATNTTNSSESQGSTDANRFHTPAGDMLQQFASVISAATSAAASAANIRGQQPFSFMVSSETAPIHLTVSTSSSRPQEEAQSTEANDGVTNTVSSAAAASGLRSGSTGIADDHSSSLSSWLFGEDSPFSSAFSMVSTLLNPQSDGSPEYQQQRQRSPALSTVDESITQPSLTIPQWAETSNLVATSDTATTAETNNAREQIVLPTKLVGVYHVLTSIVEALVDAVWLRLAQQIAYEHPNGDQLRLDEEFNRENHTANGSPTNDSRSASISTGFLIDVLDALTRELRRSSPTPVSLSGFRNSNLDSLRYVLRHLVAHADHAIELIENQARLPDLLVMSILDSHLSDSELSFCELAVERRTLEWINQQLTTGTRIVDVRATIARFLRAHVALQLDLWRTSPTNVGFGSTLLMTFGHGCVELFSLADALVGQLTSTIGLSSLPASSPSLIDFEHIRGSLQRFANRFDGPDASLCQLLTRAIDHCIERYNSADEAVLQQRREHPPTQAMAFRSILPNSHQMEMDGTNSDADMDDANFVDASDDLMPQCTSAQDEDKQTLGGQSVHLPSETSAALPTGMTPYSSLPSWTIMKPIACPLDPHPSRKQMQPSPVAPCSPTSSNSTPPSSSEDWRAVLPADWVHVVGEDVSLMAATAAVRGGDQQHRRSEVGAIGSERFSDAYLAGMPAKRRKVMQEQKLSLVKTPKVLLNECLSDAIRTSGCTPPGIMGTPQLPPSHPMPSNTTGPSVNDELSSTTALSNATREQVELVLALRNLVSERIANRLAADPDFDAALFPMSSKVFHKSEHKKPA